MRQETQGSRRSYADLVCSAVDRTCQGQSPSRHRDMAKASRQICYEDITRAAEQIPTEASRRSAKFLIWTALILIAMSVQRVIKS
jgi:hypothetical protein